MFSVRLSSNKCECDESGCEHSFIFMRFLHQTYKQTHSVVLCPSVCVISGITRRMLIEFMSWGFTLKVRVCEGCGSSVGIVTRLRAG